MADSKESVGNDRHLGSIPSLGLGRSSGEGNGNPLQYSCLENSMDRGALVGYSPWGLKESDTTERLNWNELNWTEYSHYYSWHTVDTCLCLSLSHVPLFVRPWTEPARLLCPWNSPDKNTGVGCHFFLQGIFPTQGSNPRLLHWQVDSLSLSQLGSPIINTWIFIKMYFNWVWFIHSSS